MLNGRRREDLSRRLAATVEFIAGSALFLLMFHTVVNALSRKVFGFPLPGTTEFVAVWYLPFVAFLGFVLAQRRHQHIEVRLVFDRLPRANQLELQVFSHVVTLAVLLALVWFTWTEARQNFDIGLTTGLMTEVIAWPATFLPPICFAALALQIVLSAIRTLRTRRLPGESDPLESGDEGAVAG